MEIAAQLEARNCRLSTVWAPRETIQEVDRLSNGDFRGFNPELRVEVDALSTQWLVLNSMMAAGLRFSNQAQKTAAKHLPKGKSKLREEQPW